jgi:4-hydroxy-2-oxoheptanedioate aldolase
MMKNKLKINIFLKIPNSWTAEIVSNAGFDFITIDMQHGLIDYNTMLLMLQSLKSATAKILVRSPWNEPSILMRILDAGASGIICPMINSSAEASSFVQACQYPPDGNRSFGPIRAKLVGTYSTLQQTNKEVLTFAMIETKEAIDNLEAIASTKDLHGLYIGPSDLSISLGLTKIADFRDENLVHILKNVIEVAQKYQLTTATQVYDVEQANIAKTLGFDIVTPIDDSALFENALKEKMEIIKRDLI